MILMWPGEWKHRNNATNNATADINGKKEKKKSVRGVVFFNIPLSLSYKAGWEFYVSYIETVHENRYNPLLTTMQKFASRCEHFVKIRIAKFSCTISDMSNKNSLSILYVNMWCFNFRLSVFEK